jgi:hypothetical protein
LIAPENLIPKGVESKDLPALFDQPAGIVFSLISRLSAFRFDLCG